MMTVTTPYGVEPMPDLPTHVTVYEVGPRDGLQILESFVPTEVKAEFIRRLAAAGIGPIEVTSFVPARWVPQFADAEELLGLLGDTSGPRRPCLVPTVRGLERARAAGVRDVAVFASATETFARRNLNASMAESMSRIVDVVTLTKQDDSWIRGYVSMCFGDPWEGPVEAAPVADVIEQLLGAGCDQISIGDTIGVATPGRVVGLLDVLARRGIGPDVLAVHFHDTYGQALANTLVALQHGVTTVDSSAGGLGGCPYAGSATGNLATEDLLWQLHGLGIETGVDLDAVVATSVWMAEQVGVAPQSRVVAALG